MPQLAGKDVHVNKLLTNVGVRYKNVNYICDDVFPVVPVQNKTDVYSTWGKSVWFRDEARVVAAGNPAPRINPNVTLTATYTALTYKMASPLPREIRNNADAALNLEARMTELVTDKIILGRERRVASIVNTYTNWTNYRTLSGIAGAYYWSDYTNGIPVTDIDTAQAAVEDATGGLRANCMVMGVDVWRKLRRHPDITYLIFGPGGNRDLVVTPALFAQAFEFDKVLIGRSVYASTVELLADTGDTYANIWGKYAWIGHVTNAPSLLDPSAGYCFREFYRVRSWYDDNSDTDVVEASESIDEVAVAADCGYLVTAAVA